MNNNNTYIFELLKLYWDEWKYRHDNFWKRIIQFFVAIVFISTLPITYQTQGNINLPHESLYIFPAISIILAFVFLWYSLSEAYRLASIDVLIKRITKDNYDEKYTKRELTPLLNSNSSQNRSVHKIFYARIAFWVPVLLSSIEILLSAYIIFSIANGYLDA